MPNVRRQLDWQIFWLREVLVLSVPMFIVIFALPRGEHIHTEELTVLLTVLIGLTVMNVLWFVFSASFSNRTRTERKRPNHLKSRSRV